MMNPWIGTSVLMGGVVLVGLLLTWLGTFLYVRRELLIADALLHGVLPGIVAGYLVMGQWGIVPGFLVAALIQLGWTFVLQRQLPFDRNAILGAVAFVLFGAGVLFIVRWGDQAHLDLECLLLGELEYIPVQWWHTPGFDILKLSGIPRVPVVAGCVLVLWLLFLFRWGKWLWAEAFGAPAPMRPLVLRYGWLILVTITLVLSLHTTGVVLTLALCVQPPLIVHLLGIRTFPAFLIVASLIGVVFTLAGMTFALWLDVTMAGAIATLGGLLVLLVIGLSWWKRRTWHATNQLNFPERKVIAIVVVFGVLLRLNDLWGMPVFSSLSTATITAPGFQPARAIPRATSQLRADNQAVPPSLLTLDPATLLWLEGILIRDSGNLMPFLFFPPPDLRVFSDVRVDTLFVSVRCRRWGWGTYPCLYRNRIDSNGFWELRPLLWQGIGTALPVRPPLPYGNFRGLLLQGAYKRLAWATWLMDGQWNPPHIFRRVRDSLWRGAYFPVGWNKDFSGYGSDTLYTRGMDVNPAGALLEWRPSRRLTLRWLHDFQYVGPTRYSLWWNWHLPIHTSFQAILSVGRVRYAVVWSVLKHYFRQLGTRPTRYFSWHLLEIRISPWLSIAWLEGVVQAGTDTNGAWRPPDIHYLNPIIVYRAVEHYLGSPHNMVMAVAVAIRPRPWLSLRTQIYIDDFWSKEFRRDVRYVLSQLRLTNTPTQWGSYLNKWGWIIECVLAPVRTLVLAATAGRNRPFVYTHFDSLTVMAHYRIPTGLDANTYFYGLEAVFQQGRWQISGRYLWRLTGLDEPPRRIWGHDPHNITSFPARYWYNVPGQGLPWRRQYGLVVIRYAWAPGIYLYGAAGASHEQWKTETSHTTWIETGLTWNLTPFWRYLRF